MKKILATLSGVLVAERAAAVAPVALFHGINDHCPQTEWIDAISEGIDYAAPVKCIEIGNGNISSIFERMNWQVMTACHHLHNDPDFADKEINIVGLSQGGLISRAVVERCDGLKVHTLFTFGGPHQGVSSFYDCDGFFCNPINRVLGYYAQFIIL